MLALWLMCRPSLPSHLPAAPVGSGLEGRICHRCRVYWDTYGRMPTFPK